MSRHSKNNTAGVIFTAYERTLLKYGTVSERIGADSIKPFDSCCLCLHPVVEPLLCKKGHLFCKECVYTYLLTQKKDITRQLEKWEDYENKKKQEQAHQELKDKEKEVAEFEKQISGLLPESSRTRTSSVSEEQPHKKQKLASFWVPGVRVDAETTNIQKPSSDILCPQSGHPLKMKQLYAIHFTENTNTEGSIVKNTTKAQYQCLVCCKSLSNTMKTATLQKCGHVMCLQCLDTVKKDQQCVCGKSFKDKNIIKLDNQGTGYSESSGDRLKPKKFTPAFVG